MPRLKEVGVFAYQPSAIPLLNTYKYVYIVTVLKAIDYGQGMSRIVYIGKFNQANPTVNEPFHAMGWMVDSYIRDRVGEAYVGIPVALSLLELGPNLRPEDCEGALLNSFRARYGQLPKGNKKGGAKGAAAAAEEAGLAGKDIQALLDDLE